MISLTSYLQFKKNCRVQWKFFHILGDLRDAQAGMGVLHCESFLFETEMCFISHFAMVLSVDDHLEKTLGAVEELLQYMP